MIVKNGSTILGKSIISQLQLPAGEISKTDGTKNASALSASYFAGVKNASVYNLLTATSASAQVGIVMNLGLSNTAPTLDDFWLADTDLSGVDVNTVVTCTGATVGWSATGNPIYTFLFTNTGTDDVIISEIAVSYLAGNNYGKFMLAREVLSEACTIRANETVTFSYELAFN